MLRKFIAHVLIISFVIQFSLSSIGKIGTTDESSMITNGKLNGASTRLPSESHSKVTKRAATDAEAEDFSRVLNAYFRQCADNPGHCKDQLDAVRSKLIELENKNVELTFDPKLIVLDEQLEKKIYALASRQRFADNDKRAGVWAHVAFVCMAYFACLHGGNVPDPLPEPPIESVPPPGSTRRSH